MISDVHLLLNSIRVGNSGKVQMSAGDFVKITDVGNCHLSGGDVDVLHVLEFKFNLLSMSKVTKDLKYFISFYPEFCIFQDLFSRKVKAISKEQEGLYVLKYQNKQVVPSKSMSVQTTTCPETWHKRLGHVSIRVLRKLTIFQNKNNFRMDHCSVCPLARQTRSVFQHSTTRASAPFQLIHLDVWGPYKVDTYDGMKYFVTVVDDYSRWTWIYFTRVKSDASNV